MDLLNIDSIQNLYLLKNLNALYESVSLNLFQLTRNYLIDCINNNFLILFFRVPHMKHVWSTDRFLQTSYMLKSRGDRNSAIPSYRETRKLEIS